MKADNDQWPRGSRTIRYVGIAFMTVAMSSALAWWEMIFLTLGLLMMIDARD